MYERELGPHDDPGDIEMCITVAKRILRTGMAPQDVENELVSRGLRPYIARFATIAAGILLRDGCNQ